jgi:hypothetical protein
MLSMWKEYTSHDVEYGVVSSVRSYAMEGILQRFVKDVELRHFKRVFKLYIIFTIK